MPTLESPTWLPNHTNGKSAHHKVNGKTLKPDTDTSSMIQLAKKITEETEKLDKYLKANGLPNPGFSVDAPGDFSELPDHLQRSRQEILLATKELSSLVRGPREIVRWGVWGVSEIVLQAKNHDIDHATVFGHLESADHMQLWNWYCSTPC